MVTGIHGRRITRCTRAESASFSSTTCVYRSFVRPRELNRYPASIMIRDLLLPALQRQFADRGPQAGNSTNAIAVFPAAHDAVGDLTILDDGDEATIFVGNITHLHLDGDSSPMSNVEERITDEVISFLHELFADRILLYRSRAPGHDGSMPPGDGQDFSLISPSDLTYVWSGPIPNPKRAG